MSLTLTVRKVHGTNTDKNLYFCLEKKLIQINGLVCLFHIVLQDQSRGEEGSASAKKWHYTL